MSTLGSEHARWQIMSVLKPGERLIWYDQPRGLRVALVPAASAGFMFLWTGVSLFLTLLVFDTLELGGRPGLSFFVTLFGVALTVFGLVVLIANAWRTISSWSTFYGLSDQRLIVLSRTWPGQILSLKPGMVLSVEANEVEGKIVIRWSTIRSREEAITLFTNDLPVLVAESIRQVVID